MLDVGSRASVPLGAVIWKSVGPGCLGAGLLFGGFWFDLVGAWSSWLFKFYSLHEGCSCYLYIGTYSLFQGSLFPLILLWFMQGSLFPLYGFACPFVLLVSSLYYKLVLLFLIYTILTFDQKKNDKVRYLLAHSFHECVNNYIFLIKLLNYPCDHIIIVKKKNPMWNN